MPHPIFGSFGVALKVVETAASHFSPLHAPDSRLVLATGHFTATYSSSLPLVRGRAEEELRNFSA